MIREVNSLNGDVMRTACIYSQYHSNFVRLLVELPEVDMNKNADVCAVYAGMHSDF